jgi:hypothetical protein
MQQTCRRQLLQVQLLLVEVCTLVEVCILVDGNFCADSDFAAHGMVNALSRGVTYMYLNSAPNLDFANL